MSKSEASVDPWGRHLGGLEAWDASRKAYKLNLTGPVIVSLNTRTIPEGIVEEVHRRYPNRFKRIAFEDRSLSCTSDSLGPYYRDGDRLITQVMWLFES